MSSFGMSIDENQYNQLMDYAKLAKSISRNKNFNIKEFDDLYFSQTYKSKRSLVNEIYQVFVKIDPYSVDVSESFTANSYILFFGEGITLTKGGLSLKTTGNRLAIKLDENNLRGLKSILELKAPYLVRLTKNQSKGGGLNYKLVLNRISLTHKPTEVKIGKKKSKNPSELKVVGVDVGLNYIAVSCDNSGKSVFCEGRDYIEHRRRINRVKSHKSATESIKEFAKNRDRQFMEDINYIVSSKIISSNPKGVTYSLEDLNAGQRDEYTLNSWDFCGFMKVFEQLAKGNGSRVVYVSPHKTSVECPTCKHTKKSNRITKSSKFKCGKCGFTDNDDKVAAMNIRNRGIELLEKERGE